MLFKTFPHLIKAGGMCINVLVDLVDAGGMTDIGVIGSTQRLNVQGGSVVSFCGCYCRGTHGPAELIELTGDNWILSFHSSA